MEGGFTNVQARREAEAKKRAGAPKGGATTISFASGGLSGGSGGMASSPTAVSGGARPGSSGSGSGGTAGIGMGGTGGGTGGGGMGVSPSFSSFAPPPPASGTFTATSPSTSFGAGGTGTGAGGLGGPQIRGGTFASSPSLGGYAPSPSFGAFTSPSAMAGPTSTGGTAGTKPAEASTGSGSGSGRGTTATTTTAGSGPPGTPTKSQHQQQEETAQRIAAQMKQFGIANMVLPAEAGGLRGAGSRKDDGGATDGRGGGELPSSPEGNMLSVVPRRGLMQCYVIRDKSGLKTMMNPRYALFTTRHNKFLLSSRKRANKQTSNYLISLDQEDLERNSKNFFGKVRSNVAGTEWVVYDNGCRPGEERITGKQAREELCAILYETNVAGTKGPRKITVIVPALNPEDDSHTQWRPQDDESGLAAAYRNNPDSKELVVLTNKAPTWNEQLRSYQLNFHGRVTKASVKNFQLCDVRNPARVVLQFGKVEDSKFNMDYQYPLTAMQAFAISMTAFDNKLGCQ